MGSGWAGPLVSKRGRWRWTSGQHSPHWLKHSDDPQQLGIYCGLLPVPRKHPLLGPHQTDTFSEECTAEILLPTATLAVQPTTGVAGHLLLGNYQVWFASSYTEQGRSKLQWTVLSTESIIRANLHSIQAANISADPTHSGHRLLGWSNRALFAKNQAQKKPFLPAGLWCNVWKVTQFKLNRNSLRNSLS